VSTCTNASRNDSLNVPLRVPLCVSLCVSLHVSLRGSRGESLRAIHTRRTSAAMGRRKTGRTDKTMRRPLRSPPSDAAFSAAIFSSVSPFPLFSSFLSVSSSPSPPPPPLFSSPSPPTILPALHALPVLPPMRPGGSMVGNTHTYDRPFTTNASTNCGWCDLPPPPPPPLSHPLHPPPPRAAAATGVRCEEQHVQLSRHRRMQRRRRHP
jgi:hypothetical protein